MKSHISVAAVLILFASSCSTPEHSPAIDPSWGVYVAAFTSGVVSVQEPIVVELAEPLLGSWKAGAALPENVFTLNPTVKGSTYHVDARTLHFIPENPMKPGTHYTAKLRLEKLLKVEKGYEYFTFDFQTLTQQFSVHLNQAEYPDPNDLRKLQIKGALTMADAMGEDDLVKIFRAEQNGNVLPMTWERKSALRYTFTIGSVTRADAAGTVLLSWDGAPAGTAVKGLESVAIPSLGEFSVLGAEVLNGAQQSVVIRFSDPLSRQKIADYITFESGTNYTWTFEGNRVELFPAEAIAGTERITIRQGLRNLANKPLPSEWSSALRFEQEKPGVRWVGNKAIMPISQGLIVPFQSVGLKAVDVYITKIFSNNILQFLQEENIGSQSKWLNRVGRDIYRKHIDLREVSGGKYNSWQQYHIDLADIINPDPGALYKVELRFRQSYATYQCHGTNGESTPASPTTTLTASVGSGWITDGHYYVDNYWSDYEWDWQNRDNPCSPAYYDPYRSRASRVFMASSLGLTAKMGGDHAMHVVVTDLNSAKPVANASLDLYDFQQQLIASAKSDANGFATIKTSRRAFALVATHQGHTTWLKVEEGNALSLSKFDVQGSAVQDGIKGMIYGERGVWRPGDSLYLQFAMLDRDNLLREATHPVRFELRNPKGQVVSQMTRSKHVNGFFDFRTRTESDAITGDYMASVTLGNRTFNKIVKIETVKPNRLKVALDFGQDILQPDKPMHGLLEARWLHGAGAPGLKAKVNMHLRHTKTTFEKWPGYHFDNFSRYEPNHEEETVFDGVLDKDGKAVVIPDLEGRTSNAPGMVRLGFSARVFEPGGEFSADYHTVIYAPYTSFAGMRIPESKLWGGALETDQEHSIALAVVDPYGKTVNRPLLDITLYRISQRWWYDRYDGNEYNFLNSQAFTEVKTDKAALISGKGTYTLRVPKEEWGRYLLMATDPVSGHSTAKIIYFDWPYWMRANRNETEAGNVLGMSSDKEAYTTGETIKLTFPSGNDGRALICIENGTRILRKFWVETSEGETKVEIPATPEMAPNVYAHIALIQPHANTANDRPIRVFGIIPLSVVNPVTRLEPVIKSPEVIRPESKVEITVSEQQGKAMTYTLAIVDEGLLDLTRYKTPNPWNQFYAREALGVRTWDMFDLVIGAISRQAGTLLSIGGDEDGVDPSAQKAMRFKPMVHFSGPHKLEKGNKATHKIDIPNYIGSVRVMVVAGQGEAWGNAEKAVPVRSPLMVLGTLPRVLGPGEKVKLPATVFAMEPGIGEVQVKVSLSGAFKSKNIEPKKLRFDKPGEALANFELETSEQIGIGKVTIEASNGKERSVHHIEIDVRSPNPHYTTYRDTVLQPGASWTATYEALGIKGTNRNTLEISNMPNMNLEGRLSYLIKYPHGCIEQITSAAFPQLFLPDLLPLSSEQRSRIDEHVQATLHRYREYQTGSGGFAYWPGGYDENAWGSAYAGHFMLEAESRGYKLPAGLKAGLIKSLREQARRWQGSTYTNRDYSQKEQAYRLYVLARAGAPEAGAMNLLRERSDLSLAARWILTLAYADYGQSDAARKLIQNAGRTFAPYREMGYTFGSDLRDEAFVLMALNKLGEAAEAAPLARRIGERIGASGFHSTQTLSMCLGAIAQYAGKSANRDGLKTMLEHGGQRTETATAKHIAILPLENEGKQKLTLTNAGSSMLFVRLMRSGQPLNGKEEKTAKTISMEVKYTDPSGKAIDISRLPAGTDFIAEVRLNNSGSRGDLHQMALTQIFPSGWEILNPRLTDGPVDDTANPIDHQDIRDDRVYTYFDMGGRAVLRFKIRLNATYTGRYYLPAVLCHAMYDESVMAIEPGQWVEVVP